MFTVIHYTVPNKTSWESERISSHDIPFCSSQHLREQSPLSLASTNWRDDQRELVVFLQTAAGLLSYVGQTPNCIKRKQILTWSSKISKMIWWTIKPLPLWELNWHAYLETLRNTDSGKGDLWLCEGHLCSKIHMLLISQLNIIWEKNNCARYYWEIIKPIRQRPISWP